VLSVKENVVEYEKVKKTIKNEEEDEYSEEHPAFGLIGVNRVTHGNGRLSLYGSASNQHLTTVEITVKRAERNHHLSGDWHFGREEIVRIEMSSMQFAEMLTRFNMGDGVPCTIRGIDGRSVPYIPVEDDTEIGRIKEGFSKTIRRKFSEEAIAKARSELKSLLEKKNLNKSDRKRIAALSEKLIGEIENNVPFVFDQFTESAGKVEQEVKKEVAAFTQLVVEKAGVKFLNDSGADKQIKLLGNDEKGFKNDGK
jgi:hypothetical protein